MGIDIGSKINGYFGDAAITVPIGKITENDEKLIKCAKETLFKAIEFIKLVSDSKLLVTSRRFDTFFRLCPLKDYCGPRHR